MQALQIKPTLEREEIGNLHARYLSGALFVPERVAVILAALGVRTASDLVSILQTFPSAIANQLGWSNSDVANALELLRKELEGRVERDILYPPKRESPFWGARRPPPGSSW
jgi:hypothetical protein